MAPAVRNPPAVGGQPSRPGVARPTGCYKCGKPGHWARDCPGPTAANNAGGPTAITEAQVGLEAGMPGTEATTAPKTKRTRRKVTLDLLKQTAGLPDVYHTFPEVFKRQAKGKGHEVGDLRRLLELYMRWQQRVYPGVEFDKFIADVEHLSGTNAVKHEMHEMRMALLQNVKASTQPMETEEAPPSTLIQEEPAPFGEDELDLAIEEDEDDEEDLLRLLAEPVEGTSRPEDASTLAQDLEVEDLALPDEDALALGSTGAPDSLPAYNDDDDEAMLERALAEV